MQKLPTKLGKEPLLDVIFELRFKSAIPGSYFLPGAIASVLGDAVGPPDRLPNADVPQQVRTAEPQLAYVPLLRFTWDRFTILIGDSSIAVGCTLPYEGWVRFKSAIERVVTVVLDQPLVSKLERHSLKYVDFIESDRPAIGGGLVNLDVSFGSHRLKEEALQIRTEVPEDSHVKILQVILPATVSREAREIPGIVIDIDVVRFLNDHNTGTYRADLAGLLDTIHRINKNAFFTTISDAALKSLEPSYE